MVTMSTSAHSRGRLQPPRRRVLIASLATGILVVVLGLTWHAREASPAGSPRRMAAGRVGSMSITEAFVPAGADGTGHVEAVVRNEGDSQDRLLTAALGVTTAGRGQPGSLPATVAPHSVIDLGRLTDHALLGPIDLDDTASVTVTLTFADAGSVTMRLPVDSH